MMTGVTMTRSVGCALKKSEVIDFLFYCGSQPLKGFYLKLSQRLLGQRSLKFYFRLKPLR
jgi:hypothetical protein